MLRSVQREDPSHFIRPAYNPGFPVPVKEVVGNWVGFCAEQCEFLHQFAESLGNTVDARDTLTYNHSREVAEVSYLLACALGLPSTQAEAVHIAGHLHDIGKIGIPDSVLKKEGALNDEDWHWIRKHPEIGAKIVEPVQAFSGAGGIAEIINSHHERFDGSGYPNAIRGDAIPLGARIIAVADTLSALLQDRPYRKGTSFEVAVGEIVRCSATQFDPAVVKVMRAIQKSVGNYFLRKHFHQGHY
jgi:putative nucleotidyltransferase with HDIG domain